MPESYDVTIRINLLINYHFVSIFKIDKDLVTITPILNNLNPPCLLFKQYVSFLSSITFIEIYNPFGLSSIDGLLLIFFQRWDILKEKFFDVIYSIFNFGVIPQELNETLLVLIAKCLRPFAIGHFRPINHCRTTYKFITEILSLILCPFLNNLTLSIEFHSR